MTPAEIERTHAQHREPLRIAGAAALWLVFYAAVIGGALWHGHASRTARMAPEHARAIVVQPESAIALRRPRAPN